MCGVLERADARGAAAPATGEGRHDRGADGAGGAAGGAGRGTGRPGCAVGERQLGKDSSHSSKPPSSDVPFAKPAPKRSAQRRPGRGPGKQHGTLGTTLERVEDPDKTLISDPDTCCGCSGSLADAPIFDERRHQVFDVPPPPSSSRGDRVPDRLADLRRLRHQHCRPDPGVGARPGAIRSPG
ncbi:DUF6444 domain-containing protein [Streptomyces sp. NPDC001982]|uniref:DUF6444 domain-containing protein n=1 Tax=Streptomyces sp. NPDC001982 TaxID=3154405 RepID=UPI00331C2CC3